MNALVEQLFEAGLTGRGGAAFTTGVKVAALRDHRARLIVNACDGDLGAAKDAWVVRHHLAELVEGARLVTGGRDRDVRWAAHRGSEAAAAFAAAGLRVLQVPHHYVSSEETSLISLDRGGEARPLDKPRPYVYGGRDGRGRRIPPTAVLNAETVWRVAQIHRQGAAWFRSFGTADEPGPRLATVVGHVARPVVVEAAAGIGMEGLLRAAGGALSGAEYVVVGGLGGAMLSLQHALATTWSAEGLSPYAGSIGAGVVEVLDPSRCAWDVVGERLAYGANETAGQCGPCMFGLPALARDWYELGRAPHPATRDRLRAHLRLLPGRGACRHPDGVARFAGTAYLALEDHLSLHARDACPARRVHVH